MLLCKQEETRVQSSAKQQDWILDLDDEPIDQELEAHYLEHTDQPESINDTYVVETDDRNVNPDSSDMRNNKGEVDQHAEQYEDELAQAACKNAFDFENSLNEEMREDLKYVQSLEKKLNILKINLVCQLGEKADQCKCLETELSKRHKQKPDKDFANLEHQYINLELALQHAKEKNVCENS
ncbi:hypothetical protein Tco_0026793 [Tanacetum coccineum]